MRRLRESPIGYILGEGRQDRNVDIVLKRLGADEICIPKERRFVCEVLGSVLTARIELVLFASTMTIQTLI